MRSRPPRAIIQAMNVNADEEDTMISTATFFIQTARVAGITPMNADAVISRGRAPRASARRAAPAVTRPDERFVEELLATFTDRWEW
jgi:hypothetical protein